MVTIVDPQHKVVTSSDDYELPIRSMALPATTNSFPQEALIPKASSSSTRVFVHISWRDVHFRASTQTGERHILKGLNGSVEPGRMLAIMGPSGSGKTSLLNILAGRLRGDNVTGEVSVNGEPRGVMFKRVAGYVVQDEEFFDQLTVREILRFSAKLRLPVSMTDAEKEQRIDQVINDLDLLSCADTRVGEVGKGISGGERRRLAIGVELLSNPSVLMLDEPTSGLDSASAYRVAQILSRLARGPRRVTIICTIHQPRRTVLELFDKLLLLARGETMYFGPNMPVCLTYFENAGYQCPQFENPADFMLDLVNWDDDKSTSQGKSQTQTEDSSSKSSREKVVEHLASYFRTSTFAQDAVMPPEHYPIPLSEYEERDNVSRYATSAWTQFVQVFYRSFLFKIRSPISALTQAFNCTILPLLAGVLYWGMGTTQDDIADRMSAISFLVLSMSFTPFDILLLFPIERKVYLREHAGGLYRSSSYFLGRTLSEAPQHIVFSIVASTIGYWMFGFQADAWKFFQFNVIIVLFTLVASSLFLLFGAMAEGLEQSNLLATFFLVIFMLFDGRWVTNVPGSLSWIKFLSINRYALDLVLKVEFSGLSFSCSDVQLSINPSCLPLTGAQALAPFNIDIDSVDFMGSIAVILLMIVVYRLLAFFCMLTMHTGKPWRESLKEAD